MIWRYRSRLHLSAQTLQKAFYAKAIVYKAPLHPEIVKLQDDILYSDYIDEQRWRLGYRGNKRLGTYLQNKEKTKEVDRLVNMPAISVALKYLQIAKTTEPKLEQKENSNDSQEKVIYMPYAAEDKFETVSVVENTEETEAEIDDDIDEQDEAARELDNTCKVRYEEYLEKNEPKEEFKSFQWKNVDPEVPEDWMTDYDLYDENQVNQPKDLQDPWQMKYGTPEPDSEITNIPCGGCGALLHCKDPAIPGYLPSELMIYKHTKEMRRVNCQRCHFIKNYNVSLDVKVSPEEYPKLLEKIKGKKAAVVLMIDLTDFPCCIWPDLPSIIGEKVPIFLVGNKIDLLPQDSKDFFNHVKKCMVKSVLDAGVSEQSIKYISLISATTHFGVESLISALWRFWQYRGDLYLIGCTNAGKSSLFNALIQSDYCQMNAVDLVQRATISPWPGTTLNLLKFPILRPVGWRRYERAKRLDAEKESRYAEREHRHSMYRKSRNIEHATLQSHLGRTFMKTVKTNTSQNEDLFAMDENYKKEAMQKFSGLDDKKLEYRQSRWCYDTPGTIQPDQILHLLTTQELLLTLSKQIISPRSFLFKPNQTLFLAGLGRIDFCDGPEFLRCTVFASRKLPVTFCKTEQADEIYSKLLKTPAFVVPVSDPKRLKVWPEMKGKEFTVVGIHEEESAADLILSSAGWVSITPNHQERAHFKVWTPEGRGIYVRTPSLLRHCIALRGARIAQSPAYKEGKIVFPHY